MNSFNKYRFDLGRSRHLKNRWCNHISGCVTSNVKNLETYHQIQNYVEPR